METVQQGATKIFDVGLTGDDVSLLTVAIAVLQYPGDTPTISKELVYTDNEFPGVLTSAETATLDVGQWWIHVRVSDSDEDIRAPIKLYVTKGWV